MWWPAMDMFKCRGFLIVNSREQTNYDFYIYIRELKLIRQKALGLLIMILVVLKFS